MSSARFLEIGGRRVDVTALEEIHEYRCDGCGEFVRHPVIVQGQVFHDGRQAEGFRLDLHPGCADQRFPLLAAWLAEQHGYTWAAPAPEATP